MLASVHVQFDRTFVKFRKNLSYYFNRTMCVSEPTPTLLVPHTTRKPTKSMSQTPKTEKMLHWTIIHGRSKDVASLVWMFCNF